MGEVGSRRPPQTYNGPLEAGVRAIALLAAAFPRALDLHKLTMLDYLLTRTGEIGGPANIHPPSPINVPATEVRRRIIQRALLLMMTRNLVVREISAEGFQYVAGDAAAPFLDALQGDYMLALKERAAWLAGYLDAHGDTDFDTVIRDLFDSWVAEFQSIEQSFGKEPS